METLAIRATGRHRDLADPSAMCRIMQTRPRKETSEHNEALNCNATSNIQHSTFISPGRADARPLLSLLLLARHACFISQYCRINSPWSKVTNKNWGKGVTYNLQSHFCNFSDVTKFFGQFSLYMGTPLMRVGKSGLTPTSQAD